MIHICTKHQQQAKRRYLNQLVNGRFYTCQCHRPNMSTTEPFGRLYLSPDGAVQTYVQHLIAQKHIKVWQFLRHPACHVYICGNSSMAEEVKAEVGLNLLRSWPVMSIYVSPPDCRGVVRARVRFNTCISRRFATLVLPFGYLRRDLLGSPCSRSSPPAIRQFP